MSRSPLPLSRYSRGKSRRSLSSSYDRMARRNLAPSLNPPKISLLPSTIRESQKRKRFASTFVIARIEEDRFKRLPALPRDFVFDDSRAIFNIERLSTALIVPVAMMHAWPAHIDTASVARALPSPLPPPDPVCPLSKGAARAMRTGSDSDRAKRRMRSMLAFRRAAVGVSPTPNGLARRDAALTSPNDATDRRRRFAAFRHAVADGDTWRYPNSTELPSRFESIPRVLMIFPAREIRGVSREGEMSERCLIYVVGEFGGSALRAR